MGFIVILSLLLLLCGISYAENYLWPCATARNISQYYSSYHPALDITGGGNIVATKSGTVYYTYTGCGNSNAAATGRSCSSATCNPSAGWSSVYNINGVSTCNWATGNGVVLAHDDGTYSCYAHMATVNVSRGQHVSQGTVLGTMGSTGNSTGAHLHFEVATSKRDSGTFIAMEGNLNPNPGSINYIYAPATPSFSYENWDKHYELTESSAHFGTKIYGSIELATAVGCELYNSSKTKIGSCEDGAWVENNYLIHHYLFASGSPDINIKLTAGTVYYFRYYVVASGNRYYSDYNYFKTPGGGAISYTFENYEKFYELGSNYAHFGTKIYGSVGSATDVGCELYNKSKEIIGTCHDGVAWLEGDCLIHHYLFQQGSSDINITLTPGTNYYFRYYVVANGKNYYSDYNSFKTTGTSFTVTYYANGGSGAPATQLASSTGSTASLNLSTTKPTRTGYTFLGWSKNANATSATYQSGATYSGNSDVNLYAIWQSSTNAVVYNANGGTFSIESEARVIGETYHITNSTPTFSGHSFQGWALDPGEPVSYMPGDLLDINGDITLYAIWSNTLSFVDYDKYFEIGIDYAHYGVKIYGEEIYDASYVGVELYNATKAVLGSCQDEAYREGNCLIHHYTFQEGSSDINIKLTTSTQYYFRYYVVINGGKFYSEYYSFTPGESIATEVSWTNQVCYPFKRGGYFTVSITTGQSGTFSSYQLLVWDGSGNLVIDKQDSASDHGSTMNLWYDLYTETGITLNTNSEYTYQYVVRFDGHDYSSPIYNFTTESTAGRHFGVDVSQHQGQIDWATASQYIDFAIIRCGFGGDYTENDDTCFAYNISECERLGIPYGVYLYSYAENDNEAISEADHVLRLLAGHHPELPVYYDLENENTVGRQTNAQILRQINLFCERISNAGFKTGIYANPTWWSGHLSGNNFPNNTKWLAAWNNGSYASQASNYALWQYTSDGSVPGINGRIDLNYCENFNFGSISTVVEPLPALPTMTATVEDDVLVISGTGEMDNYSQQSMPPWASETENIKVIQISDGIESIGSYAFSNMTSLTKVTIPASVTNIGVYAFNDCSSLSDIHFEGVHNDWEKIAIAEDGNSTLTAATVYCWDGVWQTGTCGESLTWSMEGHTLTITGTGDINDYEYGNSPWYAFRDDIYQIILPDGITRIGEYAFAECGIFDMTLPDSLTVIGNGAFKDCLWLETVEYCDTEENWKKISIGSGNEYLLCAIISYAETEWNITSEIVNGILTISGSGPMPAYEYEDHLEKAYTPWSDRAAEIQKVVVENGVTSIGAWAFAGLENLTSVEIGNGVNRIDTGAFYNCPNLTGIAIPDQVQYIEDNAFGRCTGLLNVDLPAGLLKIGSYAFEQCESLAEVVFPSSLRFIRASAFRYCPNLKRITFGANLKEIGLNAFLESGVQTITISEGAATKVWPVFYGISGKHLYCIIMPASLTDLGFCAFYGTALPYVNPDIVTPSGLQTIEAEAMYGTAAVYVWLNDNVEFVGDNAFAECRNLKYVYVPSNGITISPNAFPKGTMILGIPGDYDTSSYAEDFANKNGFTFIPLENPYGGNG